MIGQNLLFFHPIDLHPCHMQLPLDLSDREEAPENARVGLHDVSGQDQIQRSLDFVVQRQPVPSILVVVNVLP